MSERPIVVLKFGSSVLCNEDCLPDAVSEIYRWYREGHAVIAVVSAIGETTDALFAQARRLSPGASAHRVASLVATGELTSAALLGLSLDRAGVPGEVLDHRQLGLRARGEALDEDPVTLDVSRLRSRLDVSPVLVVPGFLAVDEQNRTVLLGRGGSDLTAVFIAEQLQASRCRLIKDVDGVYDRDPNAAASQHAGVGVGVAGVARILRDGEREREGASSGEGDGARKYRSITFDHAHELSGAILQAKATAFAERRRYPFEVAALQSNEPSVVGATESVLQEDDEPCKRRPIRVALLGLGTVGGGVLQRLLDTPTQFEVTRVLVRSKDRRRDVEIDPNLLTDDPAASLRGDEDLVVDALNDAVLSRRIIGRALARGVDVVTVNKAVVAPEYDDLFRAAERSGALLRFSGAVGGALPVLERMGVVASTRRVRSIRGVLNGSTNFILEAIARGDDLERAIERARGAGLCERDATTDLSGLDAAHKLSIIAQHGLGLRLDPHSIPRFDRNAFAAGQPLAVGDGRVVRQVGTIILDDDGHIEEATVNVETLSSSDRLSQINGEANALVITCGDGTVEFITGLGAGRWPTTEAVMADIHEIARHRQPAQRAESGPEFVEVAR